MWHKTLVIFQYSFVAWMIGLSSFPKVSLGIRLYYTANRHGEAEPCGCQVKQLGGLHRLKSFLDEDRKGVASNEALFVDSGDTFFASVTIAPNRRDQALLRAQLISESYRRMGLNFLTPGERDFGLGLDTLKELGNLTGAALLSSNIVQGGQPAFDRFKLVEFGKAKVGIMALADPQAFKGMPAFQLVDPRQAGQEVVTELRQLGAQWIILLSHLGFSADRELAEVVPVDTIVGAHSLDVLSKPERLGKTLIVQAGFEGQQIGVLDFDPSNPEKVEHRLVDLDERYEKQNDVVPLMVEYKEKIKQRALLTSPSLHEPKADNPFIAHPSYCRACHSKQYEWWATTKHASAYLVLYAKNQHFDPECVECHSLGYLDNRGFGKIAEPYLLRGKRKANLLEALMKKVFVGEKVMKPLDSRSNPSGYEKLHKRYLREVEKLEADGKLLKWYVGVQCEHCHGNRHGHPDPNVSTLKKVSEDSCRLCHRPPNVTEFDPNSIKSVACPLSSKS